MANDIIARLRLSGQKFTEDTRATFSAFNREAVSSAQQAKSAFESNFAEIRSTVRDALKVQPNASGAIDLNVSGRRAAAAAAEQEAQALRDVATAAQRLAINTGDTSTATKLYVQAAQAAANEAEHGARELKQQADAYDRLQAELNQTKVAQGGLNAEQVKHVAVSGQARQAMQSLGQQATDFSVQVLSGTSAFTAFAQQAPQAGLALAGFEGKLGKVGAFLTGPWGIALTIGVSALGILGSKLLETGDSAKVAEDALRSFAARQSDIGNFIDQTTGRLIRQNEVLIQNAVLMRQDATAKAGGRVLSNRDAAFAAARRGATSTVGMAGGSPVQVVDPEVERVITAAGGSVVKLNQGMMELAKRRPEWRGLAKDVNGFAAQAAYAYEEVNRQRGELSDLNTVIRGGTVVTTRLIDQQVSLAEATDAVSKAQARLNTVRQRAAAIDRMQPGAERDAAMRQYRDDLTAATREVNGARQAKKDAATAKREAAKEKREAEKARRAAERLTNQQQEAEQRIANTSGRFDVAPRLVDQMDAANRALDEEIAKYGKLTDAVSKAIVAKAQAAKVVVAQAPAKPLNDLVRQQERGLELQRMTLQGRDVEAAALAEQYRLMDLLGATSAEQLQTILEKAGVEGDVVGILQRQAAQQEAVSRAMEDQRRQVGLYAGAVGDAQRTFDNFLFSIGQGKRGGAFKDLGRDLLASFNGLNTRLLSEKVFGGLDRELADLVQGRTGIRAANDFLSEQTADAGNALKQLADTVVDVRQSLIDGTPVPTADGLQEGVSYEADGTIRIEADTKNPGLDKNTAALFSAAQTYNVIGGKLVGRLSDLGIKMPKVLSEELGKNLGTYLSGASLGAVTGKLGTDALGSKGSTLGGAIGGALGKKGGQLLEKGMTEVFGKTLGSFAGPLGSIAGSVLGSALGGLFKKSKQGVSTISFGDQGLYAGEATGRGSAEKAQAAASANSVIGSVEKIAEALGGSITGAGTVSIGYRPGRKEGAYRVDTTGRGRVTGVYAFETEEEAIRFAIADALKDGVVGGISDASKRILAAGKDLESAIEKASLIESIPKQLKAMTDPLGAAIDELNAKFKKTIAALKEGGATAEQMAQAQQLYDLQLAEVKKLTGDAAESLKTFLTSMKVGSSSPLSLRDQEAAARETLQPFLAAIDAGKAIDQEKYQDAANAFLDIERQLYGSTAGFFAEFDRIQAATTKAIERIDNAVPISAASADSFGRSTADNTATTATNTGVGNELLSQLSDQIAEMQLALDAIAGNTAASGGGGFIGTGRQFVQAA